MDAEIRRLTYVQRHTGSKVWSGIPDSALIIGALPGTLPRDGLLRHSLKNPDVRLEARIIELEGERSEIQKRHREELAASHQLASESLAAALAEQKETLEQTYAMQVAATLASFREEQKRYFREAESAVVRLALGVATRVLHREAQLDPLLLRGAVRVALEDAQQGTRCVLEVPAKEVEKWRHWISSDTPAVLAEVRGREDVASGHCQLRIGASTADLSVHAQLAEIERGFFDLLQSRQGGVASEGEQNQ